MGFFDDRKRRTQQTGTAGMKDPRAYGFTQGGDGGGSFWGPDSGSIPQGASDLLDSTLGEGLDFMQGAAGSPGTLNEETSQNELFKQVGAKQKPTPPMDEEGKARWSAFHNALGDLKRRRNSRTMLTSGIGATGTPGTTAVSSLLGY